jgi:antirestriction protein
MTDASDSNPRIYVACLAAYNNGYLHGAWIDADQDTDQIRDEIAAMLARSPVEDVEEYAIHD